MFSQSPGLQVARMSYSHAPFPLQINVRGSKCRLVPPCLGSPEFITPLGSQSGASAVPLAYLRVARTLELLSLLSPASPLAARSRRGFITSLPVCVPTHWEHVLLSWGHGHVHCSVLNVSTPAGELSLLPALTGLSDTFCPQLPVPPGVHS